MNSLESSTTYTIAELYSSPTATYNGELINPRLQTVEKPPPPPGYQYGAVSDSAAPFLAAALILSIGIGAIVPMVLSIGDIALRQQRERENETRIGDNQFAKENRKKK
jgi:hypothetical protein